MCGIVCTFPGDLNLTVSMLEILEEYVGGRNAFRFFGSMGGSGTGLMALSNGKLSCVRSNSFAGDVSRKAKNVGWRGGEILVGHTRFSDIIMPIENRFVHPYSDCRNLFFVVHNGAISKYEEYYGKLLSEGHEFKTEDQGRIVDSEVIPHLLEDRLRDKEIGIESVLTTGKSILKELGRIDIEEGLGIFVALIEGLNAALIVNHIHSWGNTLKFWWNRDTLVISTYNVLPHRQIILEPPPYGGTDLQEMNERIDDLMRNRGFDEVGYAKRKVVFVVTSEAKIISLYQEKPKEERIDESNLIASSIKL
ncbi:MAG: hypothetical protein ACFE7A_01510 [Promethearchaeota archaeon]